jgi:biopolymer transport protein ExbD
MKLKGAKAVHYDSGPNMTPLVDVVMVILIFLMLAGSFGTNSHYLTSNLPVQGGGGPKADPKPGEIPDEIIEVQIFPDSVHGFRVISGDIKSKGPVDGDWLTREFARKMAQYEASKTPISKLQVVLFPSANTRYDHIALVYEAALRAKFEKVAFRTSQ